MDASHQIRHILCTVVQVPVADDQVKGTDSLTSNRPSDRLPWSDPIIARLVSNLQDEVRGERRRAKLAARTYRSIAADLDPPCPFVEHEPDWRDQPRWTWPN